MADSATNHTLGAQRNVAPTDTERVVFLTSHFFILRVGQACAKTSYTVQPVRTTSSTPTLGRWCTFERYLLSHDLGCQDIYACRGLLSETAVGVEDILGKRSGRRWRIPGRRRFVLLHFGNGFLSGSTRCPGSPRAKRFPGTLSPRLRTSKSTLSFFSFFLSLSLSLFGSCCV